MPTIAHLSDVHLAPLPPIPLARLNLKRALGWLNWQRRRRAIHRREVLDRLVADLVALRPDHIVVTGDLANLGLPAEHEAALDWLATLGSPEQVTVVPGNHDIYSTIGADEGVARWRSYMGGSRAAEFPFVRRIAGAALVGVNSAVPTRPFQATGTVGERQREAVERTLVQLAAEEMFRIVLIHHPPLPGRAKRRHELTDAAETAAMLARSGADLVLHGHNHRAELVLLPSHRHDIPVVGVPSASAGHAHGEEPLARYNIYSMERSPAGTHIVMTSRGLLTPDGPLVEIERRPLTAT